jgi:hypothetical protein
MCCCVSSRGKQKDKEFCLLPAWSVTSVKVRGLPSEVCQDWLWNPLSYLSSACWGSLLSQLVLVNIFLSCVIRLIILENTHSITKVQVPPYATPVFISLFITPFTLHVSALLIDHLQV